MISIEKFAVAWGAAALTVAGVAYIADLRNKAMRKANRNNSNGSIY